jgi:RNA polymerase sigma-70 factor (ECF subfamily)
VKQSFASVADERLLRRTASGDQQAFEELYRRHSGPIYNYLLRLLHEPAVAEDLLQEVFVATWQGAHRFEGRAQVKTWLLGIAHNQAVSWLRRNRNVLTLDDIDDLPLTDPPDAKTMDVYLAAQLSQAIDGLSPKHRAVVELAFAHNLSYAEIAEIVGCPVGTVKSRMSYALKCLNGSLKRMDLDDRSE